MSEKENKIKVENNHDSHKITMYLPDDVAELTPVECDDLAKRLVQAAKHSRENVPPAPRPHDVDGHGDKGKGFCVVGPCNKKYDCYAYIGGYEISIKDVVKIRDWINKALIYHNKKHCLGDK